MGFIKCLAACLILDVPLICITFWLLALVERHFPGALDITPGRIGFGLFCLLFVNIWISVILPGYLAERRRRRRSQ